MRFLRGAAAGAGIRAAILAVITAMPLAFGGVPPEAFGPLLVVGYGAGLAAWARGRWAQPEAGRVEPVPGWRELLGLHGLVAAQLLPLPNGVLRALSPGSYAACCIGLSSGGWHTISVDPAATLRGLVFLAGLSLMYGAVVRELASQQWRRRLCGALVLSGVLLSLAGLVQEASAHPRWIYGYWRPPADWAVFGPYFNRNHFAGYLAMVAPLAISLAVEAVGRALDHWRRRGFWSALGDRGAAAMLRPAAAACIVVGLLISHVRGGIVAFLVSIPVLLLLSRWRGLSALLAIPLTVFAATRVSLLPVVQGFETRGFNRLEVWLDALHLVEHFPWLGAGFNAFEAAYWPYQTVDRSQLWNAAHNEYLQVLLDTGVIGLALVCVLLARLLRIGAGLVGGRTLTAGVFAALAASAVHASVDFVWQIPANAAAFAALCGLAATSRKDRAP